MDYEEGPEIEIDDRPDPRWAVAAVVLVCLVIILVGALTILSIGKGDHAPLPSESPTIDSVEATVP